MGAIVALTASCLAASETPESVGSTSSGVALPGLFSTGVNGAGAPLAVGATDTHYALVSADPAAPGPTAIAVTPAGGWTGSTATSRWISGRADTAGIVGGVYTYSTTFNLVGLNPASATLSGTWSCDDTCTMSINGTQVAQRASPGWGSTTAFNVAAGGPFTTGVNTLSVVVTNTTGGPTGLQIATIGGTAAGCTADVQCAANQFCNTQSSTCTATLANGTAIPTISGHTPALTGTCSALVGAAVCASTACDTADGKCGFANGDGMCGVATPAVCRSGACSVNGTCVAAGGCNVDADCTSSQFCTESTHACTARLANGTAIPTDAGHTPTLNGACTQLAATLVCQSGVCDADNKCGLAEGTAGCTLATPGVCRSGACSNNGRCEPAGGCNVDADCTGGKWCNESSHSCTAQLTNGAPIPTDPGHSPTLDGTCTANAATLVCQTGVCDGADNKCGYADGDGACTSLVGGAVVCRSGACSLIGACRPSSGCDVDGDCATGNWCSEATHTCKPTLANGAALPVDAPHTSPTLDGNCTQPAATLVCQSALCSTTTKTCVACTATNLTACAGTTPACTASGGCAACNGDYGTAATATCPGSTTPYCTGTGSCGKCMSNSDCATGTRGGPVCDVTTGACIPSGTDGGIVGDAGGGLGDGSLGDAGLGDGGSALGADGGDDASSNDGGNDAGDDASDGAANQRDATTPRDSGQPSEGAGDTTPTGSELGGGGFSCAVSRPGSSTGSDAAAWIGIIGLGAVVTRTRRQRKH